MDSILTNALDQALAQLAGHTGYDAIRGIWDAVEGGNLSHGAALQATAILAADLERQRQHPAQPPQPHPQPRQAPMSPLDIIRAWPEYQTLQRN